MKRKFLVSYDFIVFQKMEHSVFLHKMETSACEEEMKSYDTVKFCKVFSFVKLCANTISNYSQRLACYSVRRY